LTRFKRSPQAPVFQPKVLNPHASGCLSHLVQHFVQCILNIFEPQDVDRCRNKIDQAWASKVEPHLAEEPAEGQFRDSAQGLSVTKA